MNNFFTQEEIKAARGLSHDEVKELVRPIMARINEQSGQENNLSYMTFLLQFLSIED